ncbi:MAG: hypothetical protein ACYDCB_08565, partial [Candidatus Dormibacteria bacterium]
TPQRIEKPPTLETNIRPPSPLPGASARSWWGRPLTAVIALLLVVPVGVDFWFIHSFGVNVPFADSWNGTLPLVKDLATGHLQLAELWAPHNENRMLFPNLILAIVDSHNRVNALDDMYLTAGLMAAALALLMGLARRTTDIPMAWLVPVPFLFFSLAQVGNLLWAFQLAWMLIVLCLMVSLHGLESSRRHPALFLLACLAAVIASFSSLQGLLLWPAGLVYGLGRGLSRTKLTLWCAAGLASTAVYAWHIGNVSPVSSPTYALSQPGLAVKYFLQLLGDVVPDHHTLFALLVLGASAVVGWLWYRGRVSLAKLRLPLALWLSGILFDCLVTIGRLQLNAPESSRYTTYNLVLLIGLYLGAVAAFDPPRRWQDLRRALPSRVGPGLLTAVVLAAVVLQVVWSVPNGIQQGYLHQASRERGAQLLLNYRSVADSKLAVALFPPSGAYVKVWAQWLQSKHWSVFR